ncbi:MAG: Asp-tRNA(Asn)/Glu-tRNA(Gln) amidotransferase GatCAB subunit A [Desulfurococcales archaeon ex4484_204]|nr:MAG: Asp-tRNA(Asn)/Glu-tRNA(Gln) amidotransferase GatCAB subunit A [Desulfurococcales archaeon ex4484_204]
MDREVLTLSGLRAKLAENPKFLYEYIEFIYDVIDAVEGKVKAFITLRSKDDVLREADRVVDKLIEGRAGRLAGALLAVKDNIVTKGLRTTCASKILSDFIPPYNATVVDRILREDAIIIGKTNMDEFAMGSTTENSAFFPTRNPWDLSRVPGGSSGGSAAAVSALEATAALGTDTGGSVRAPAAFTATVGLKPTYGLVSRYGLIAYASSMDQVGPIGRTVTDVSIILDVISGRDVKDATSTHSRGGYREATVEPFKVLHPKLRVAVIEELVVGGVEKPVKHSFLRTLRKLESNGIDVIWLNMPISRYSLPAYYIIAMAEASSNLARYDGIRYGLHESVEGRPWYEVYTNVRTRGFGKEVKHRILLGSFVLSAGYYDEYYLRASKVRKIVRDSLLAILREHDAVISPTMPVLPPKLGERIADPLKLYAIDINTVLANLAGVPAISIPSDIVNDLPVAVQLMGNEFDEVRLVALARVVEGIINLAPLVPPLVRRYV